MMEYYETLSIGEQILMGSIIGALIGAVTTLIVSYIMYLGKIKDVLKNTEDVLSNTKHDGVLDKQLATNSASLSKEHENLSQQISLMNSKVEDLWKNESGKNGRAEQLSHEAYKTIDGLHAAERIILNFQEKSDKQEKIIQELRLQIAEKDQIIMRYKNERHKSMDSHEYEL